MGFSVPSLPIHFRITQTALGTKMGKPKLTRKQNQLWEYRRNDDVHGKRLHRTNTVFPINVSNFRDYSFGSFQKLE